jgi:enamine deaminase RidA (YjgF/YER057c/UK114 family)
MESLGIILPPAAAPRANYNIVCHASSDNMLYVSGHLPFQADGTLMTGRIVNVDNNNNSNNNGRDVEYGYQAARWAGLNIVATLKEQLGDLDRIEQIVKIFGIVQSSDDFKSQHLVMDGCSDVLMEIFGKEVGYHARSAIGTSTLPLDITVEVEAIVQLKKEE